MNVSNTFKEVSGTKNHEVARANSRSHLNGLLLSIVFTLSSFSLTIDIIPILPIINKYVAVIFCTFQILVQLLYFLHLDKSQYDHIIVLVFTACIIAIIIGGSAWVLHNMNANMMAIMIKI